MQAAWFSFEGHATRDRAGLSDLPAMLGMWSVDWSSVSHSSLTPSRRAVCVSPPVRTGRASRNAAGVGMADGGRELGGWLRAGGRRAAGAECGEQRALPNNALRRSKFFSLRLLRSWASSACPWFPHGARARSSLACEERAEQVGDATCAMHGHVEGSKSTAQLLCT